VLRGLVVSPRLDNGHGAIGSPGGGGGSSSRSSRGGSATGADGGSSGVGNGSSDAADVYFNDKAGNVYQVASPDPRSINAALLRVCAKTRSRLGGMAVLPATTTTSGGAAAAAADGGGGGGGGTRAQLVVAELIGNTVLAVADDKKKSFKVWVDRVSPAAVSPQGWGVSRRKFLGPSCLLPDKHGRLFFSDAGGLRDCSTGSLKGSVFVAEPRGQGGYSPSSADASSDDGGGSGGGGGGSGGGAGGGGSSPSSRSGEWRQQPVVTPIIDGGLAYPTGMAWLGKRDLLVCESFLNRVLRVTQDPRSLRWHVRIFAAFQQRFGPTAVVVRKNSKRTGMRQRAGGDRVSVFVAHSVLRATAAEEAMVLRLTPQGTVAEEYPLPGCTYVTSIALRSPDSLLLTCKNMVLQLDI
jgi:hypothetical protein